MPDQRKKRRSSQTSGENPTGRIVKLKGHSRRKSSIEGKVQGVSSAVTTESEANSATKIADESDRLTSTAPEHERRKKAVKAYQSGALAGVHETMAGLRELGLISKQTMAEFNEMCLTELIDLSPQQIQGIRARENVSQDVFARYLNVSKSTVSKWERGEKKPSGPALKLLTLVKNNGLDAVA